MSEANNDNDSNEAETTESSIDISELSEEQLDALTANPEVQKMLRYEETAIPQIAGMLRNLSEAEEDTEQAEAFDLLVSGIAERSGRVTEKTVRKVLGNLPAEYDSVQ